VREIKFEVLADPSMFTPVQLQPRSLMSVGFNAWSRWAKEYFVPFPTMVRDYRFGMVVVGGHLEYAEPLGCLEADAGAVRARVRARLGGAFVQVEFSATAAGKRAARGTALLVPVKIDEMHSLSATPARLSNELLAFLESDEVDAEPPQRPVPGLINQIEADGRKVAEASYPFTVYRHACEMADQWCAVQIPCYVSEAREALALGQGDRVPQLRRDLNLPLRYFDMELRRPMFVFDRGSVTTQAYDVQGRSAFVHRLVSADEVHALVVERF